MTAEDLSTDEVTRAQLVAARRFVGQRCLMDPQLIIPMRLLWRGFQAWSQPLGVEPSAVALRLLIDGSPWARAQELGGKGRIRVMVHGLGLKA